MMLCWWLLRRLVYSCFHLLHHTFTFIFSPIQLLHTASKTDHQGSGKSTQIPAYIHESGILTKSSKEAAIASSPPSQKDGASRQKYGRTICVTQPRRVAAITLAKRVSEELNCTIGTIVGHRVRFDDTTDVRGHNTTKIIYLKLVIN